MPREISDQTTEWFRKLYRNHLCDFLPHPVEMLDPPVGEDDDDHVRRHIRKLETIGADIGLDFWAEIDRWDRPEKAAELRRIAGRDSLSSNPHGR